MNKTREVAIETVIADGGRAEMFRRIGIEDLLSPRVDA